MTRLYFETIINSEKEIVFDLSRSIDFHLDTMIKTKEKVIAGRSTGLIEKDESVTWQGKHFGVSLTHTSKITHMNKYYSFTDEMTQGYFQSFIHHHLFIAQENKTIMIDVIDYEIPFGKLGKLFNKLFLKKYLSQLIMKRNNHLKQFAEKQGGCSNHFASNFI